MYPLSVKKFCSHDQIYFQPQLRCYTVCENALLRRTFEQYRCKCIWRRKKTDHVNVPSESLKPITQWVAETHYTVSRWNPSPSESLKPITQCGELTIESWILLLYRFLFFTQSLNFWLQLLQQQKRPITGYRMTLTANRHWPLNIKDLSAAT